MRIMKLLTLERSCLRCASFLYYLRTGKEFNYPTCCVLHFAWDAARKKPPALRRGSVRISATMEYVPCAFHKGRHPKWKPFRRGTSHQPTLF